MVNSILPRMWLIEDQRCTLKHCTSWNMPNAVLESCGDPKPHPRVCKPSFCKVTDTTEQLWFHSLLFRDMVRGGRQAGEGGLQQSDTVRTAQAQTPSRKQQRVPQVPGTSHTWLPPASPNNRNVALPKSSTVREERNPGL